MPRKPMTEEEKEQRKQTRLANKEAKENEIRKFASLTLTELISYEDITKFLQKVNQLNNADEKQVLTMLLQSFINGDIEFEEKTILSIKQK